MERNGPDDKKFDPLFLRHCMNGQSISIKLK